MFRRILAQTKKYHKTPLKTTRRSFGSAEVPDPGPPNKFPHVLYNLTNINLF